MCISAVQDAQTGGGGGKTRPYIQHRGAQVIEITTEQTVAAGKSPSRAPTCGKGRSLVEQHPVLLMNEDFDTSTA